MSIIVHRCDCGHIADWHRLSECSGGLCPCTRRPETIRTPPETIPTYPTGQRQPVPTVSEPGTRWGEATLCGCDQCHDLYRQVGETVPA